MRCPPPPPPLPGHHHPPPPRRRRRLPPRHLPAGAYKRAGGGRREGVLTQQDTHVSSSTLNDRPTDGWIDRRGRPGSREAWNSSNTKSHDCQKKNIISNTFAHLSKNLRDRPVSAPPCICERFLCKRFFYRVSVSATSYYHTIYLSSPTFVGILQSLAHAPAHFPLQGDSGHCQVVSLVLVEPKFTFRF